VLTQRLDGFAELDLAAIDFEALDRKSVV